MLKIYCLILLTLTTAVRAISQSISTESEKQRTEQAFEAQAVRFVRVGDSVQVVYELDFKNIGKIDKDNIVLVQTYISGDDGNQVVLPSVGVYGRNPYYFYYRSAERWLQRPDDIMFRAGEHPDRWLYVATVPYMQWMQNAAVDIVVSDNDYCDGQTLRRQSTVCTVQPKIIKGETTYEVTKHTVSGEANVDYVVNIMKLDPDYHDNQRELDKIRVSIDSLRSNPDNEISGVRIKGWASPEGPYWNNIRLAKGRSESLSDYVSLVNGIDPGIMQVEFEPEDWEGFRKMVEASDLPHKQEIIDIIDDTRRFDDPDKKLDFIRRTYKREWDKVIYPHMMPYLRHTRYWIEYVHTDRTKHVQKDDTLWMLPTADRLLSGDRPTLGARRKTWAVKTNLLFDAALAFNFEVEVPFGKERKYSFLVEDWFPWYVWHHNHRAYQVWNVGFELRRWFYRCYGDRPLLTGWFTGPYIASGKYDIERHGKGEQGEYLSLGWTGGYSWTLGRNWNLECSGSLGVIFGPQRHYHGEFNDRHLIWKENRDFFYVGPTKLKLSLVWLLPNLFKGNKEEGGAL